MKNLRIASLTGAAALAAFSSIQILPAPAGAVAPIDGFPLPPLWPGADALSLEGGVLAIDVAARTINVDGSVVHIPATLRIDTDGDGVGDITFEQLTASNLRSAVGGYMAVEADVASVNGLARFTANAAYFEFGEHVVVGALMAVNAQAGTFMIAGTPVRLSTDARIPAKVVDLGGNSIALADMAGWEGTLAAVEGYMLDGVLRAKLVETDVVLPAAGSDAIVIEKALYNPSKRSIEVRGTITAHPTTGAFAPNVQIDLSCDGLGIINANVVPDLALGQGEWRWKSANNAVPTNPGSVCVRSTLGGNAQRATN
ncbi:MAG: hypothetical protein RL112_2186 [Planctomycetota bacterium]